MSAADSLAGFYMRKKQYDKAEKYLEYFSIQNPERKRKQAQIYAETGRMQEAYKAYEELLFTDYQRVSMELHGIYLLALKENDMEKARSIVQKQAEAAKFFEMGKYYEVSSFLEIAALEKDADTVIAAMEEMLSGVEEIESFRNSSLYEHMEFKEIKEEDLEDVDLVLAGKYTPKPLILRANVGDWLEVTLHNLWDPDRPVPYFNYPTVPLELKHKPSARVSLNPQFLKYDPVCDSGINVGYNPKEQTVGIGESKRYLWKADREYGTCILQSFGDMRNHRYHGLFGAVIVEPAGARWYENFSKKKNPFAEQAVITAPGTETFREYVLFIQNGIRLLDAQGNLVQTAAADSEEPVEAEDTGEKGYNYRSERFANRLSRDGRVWKVFSSKVHGDPATPVYKAYPGDRVIFRTMMPADKPRNVSLTIHGHLWREQPRDALSREIPLQGGISIGNRFDMELKGGASCPGDYLYRSGSFGWDVESGMWGIFRVMKQSIRCRCKELCKKIFVKK